MKKLLLVIMLSLNACKTEPEAKKELKANILKPSKLEKSLKVDNSHWEIEKENNASRKPLTESQEKLKKDIAKLEKACEKEGKEKSYWCDQYERMKQNWIGGKQEGISGINREIPKPECKEVFCVKS